MTHHIALDLVILAGYIPGVIKDPEVLKILERSDLPDGKDKILLIYILSKEPEPKKIKDQFGIQEVLVGMAKIGPKQFKKGLGKGFHEGAVKKRIKNLKKRGFLHVESDKGGIASRYRVKFPVKQAKPKQPVPDQTSTG